ncbi:MAG: hypothetical protein AAF797_14970 [Planctomycetota bacterium]
MKTRQALTPLLALALLSAPAATAAVVPFAEDFDDNTETFAETSTTNTFGSSSLTASSSAFSIQPDTAGFDYQYAGSVTATGGNNDATSIVGSAALEFTNTGSAGVIITSDFNFDGRTISTLGTRAAVTAGLAAYGSGGDFGTDSHYRLTYVLDDPNRNGVAGVTGLENGIGNGVLVLEEIGGDGQIDAVSTGSLAVSTSADYSFAFSIEIVGGSAEITASITDGVNTINVSGTDTTPLTGDFFGYRTEIAGSGNTVSADLDFDNYAINAIPEPASLTLLACAGCCLTLRRRPRV